MIYNTDKGGQYFTLIDLDKHEAIQEFCTINGKARSLEEIAEKFIVEQHSDDKDRAHIYFYSPILFVNKSADNKTGIEIKGLGEHGISNCAPSLHQNKDPSDSNEYRYQMIRSIVPAALERKQALDIMYHLHSFCSKNGVEYLHKDHRSNKLNLIIKSLKIDPAIEIGEGERHLTLFSAADSLLLRHNSKGKTKEELKSFFLDLNQQLCHPIPLPEDELSEIWNSALEYVNRIKSGPGLDPSEGKSDGNSNLIESTSEQIKHRYSFVALPSRELLYYNNGVYTTGGEIIIEKEAETL